MSDLQPVDPIDECVRLAQELSRLQTEYKEMLDEAVVVESERNTLKRENAEMNDDIRCIELELSLLQAENAALRADKERYAGLLPLLARWLKMADDCHSECQEVGYSEYNITAGLLCDTRAAIRAARKEAQP